MLYLKYFEELSFKPDYEPHWTKSVLDKQIQYSFELSDTKFSVYFDKVDYKRLGIDDDNIYEREYRSDEGGFNLVGLGANKIIAVITAITYDFIKEYKPSCIIIHHINIRDENTNLLKLNKRARLNYQFLKNIEEYKLSYYGMKLLRDSNKSSATLCMISKPNFDCDTLVKSWDRNIDYQRHILINNPQ